MLYPFAFESLYELNVSRLRRLMYSCPLAEEERYLRPRGHESFAEEGRYCYTAYLDCPRGRRILFDTVSQSSYPTNEENEELTYVLGRCMRVRTGRASCPMVRFLHP